MPRMLFQWSWVITTESIASFSKVLISQNLIADAERKDDTTTIGAQIDCNSIDPLSEVLNNQDLIAAAETKEVKTKIDKQFNYNSIGSIAESVTPSQ